MLVRFAYLSHVLNQGGLKDVRRNARSDGSEDTLASKTRSMKRGAYVFARCEIESFGNEQAHLSAGVCACADDNTILFTLTVTGLSSLIRGYGRVVTFCYHNVIRNKCIDNKFLKGVSVKAEIQLHTTEKSARHTCHP